MRWRDRSEDCGEDSQAASCRWYRQFFELRLPAVLGTRSMLNSKVQLPVPATVVKKFGTESSTSGRCLTMHTRSFTIHDRVPFQVPGRISHRPRYGFCVPDDDQPLSRSSGQTRRAPAHELSPYPACNCLSHTSVALSEVKRREKLRVEIRWVESLEGA